MIPNRSYNFKHTENCKCDICILDRFKRSPPSRTENESTPKPPSKYKLKLTSSYKI